MTLKKGPSIPVNPKPGKPKAPPSGTKPAPKPAGRPRSPSSTAPAVPPTGTDQGTLFGAGDSPAADIADSRLLMPQHLAAIAFNISVQALQRWKVKPRMKRGKESLYYLPDLVDYRLHRDVTGKLNLGDERARLAAAQADRAEIEIAELRGEMISAELVTLTWSTITTAIRQKVLGIPGKIKSRIPALTARETAKIKAIVRQSLEDVADHAADKPKPKRARVKKSR